MLMLSDLRQTPRHFSPAKWFLRPNSMSPCELLTSIGLALDVPTCDPLNRGHSTRTIQLWLRRIHRQFYYTSPGELDIEILHER